MNDTNSSNPPAFPERHGPELYVSGMTLRDYFAAAALQGAISYGGLLNQAGDVSLRAKKCYEHADAMLVAREAAHDS